MTDLRIVLLLVDFHPYCEQGLVFSSWKLAGELISGITRLRVVCGPASSSTDQRRRNSAVIKSSPFAARASERVSRLRGAGDRRWTARRLFSADFFVLS